MTPGVRLLVPWTLLTLGLAPCGVAQSVNPCAGTVLPASPPDNTVLFPLVQVRRGLCGVGYTVFEGVNPEPMQVEILGLLKNSRGPGQDMILARLHGLKPEYTGVVAGMSGSPVYVDGKLLGALSFRIGQFSKEPIAGITPIAEMLDLGQAGASGTGGVAGTNTAALSNGVAATAIDTPLVFAGFTQEAIDRFGDRFRTLGLTPMAGLGAASSDLSQPEPLVPGSAVSAILVRGDLSVAGTCTVSYLDKSKLLACGHPITQFGHVAFPMTKATVLATLPSPLNAFKIITTTETVGQFTEDRNAAILGKFGESARMIPVQIDLTGDAFSDGHRNAQRDPEPQRKIRFEVVDNKELTPSLMLVSIFQSIQQTNLASAEASYRVTGEMKVAGQPPIELDGIVAPNENTPVAINAALFVNERFSRIYNNAASQPVVTSLNLSLRAAGPNRTAALERVRLSQTEVSPGDTIETEVTLHPVRSEPVTLRIPVTIPLATVPGDLRLLVSDGATADRTGLVSSTGLSGHIIPLTDVVRQLNRMHRNDRVYVTLLAGGIQTALDGETMQAVPLSMANVYESQRSEQKLQLTGESADELGSADAGFAVSGAQVFTLRVK